MNVARLLTKMARTYPNRPAMRFGAQIWTYSQFQLRVSLLGGALLRMGLTVGDRVAIVLRNHPRIFEAYFASFRAGLAVVPLNQRLHPKELAYMIQHSQARVVIADADSAKLLKPLLEHLQEKPLLVSFDGAGEFDYEAVLENGVAIEDAEVSSDDLAWLFYTSGTTGNPKGAMLSHRNLFAMVLNYLSDVYAMQPEDVVLHAAPLTHGSGLYGLCAVARGAHNIITSSPSFSPAEVYSTILECNVTNIAFLTPTMIKMMMSHPDANRARVTSLRCIVYGGGPMYAEDLLEACRRWGCIFAQIYGQAEAPMTITYLRREDHAPDSSDTDWATSAGVEHTGTDVRIVDREGRFLPPGGIGEVVVRGDIVMVGYWNNPQATAETIRGGWLHTGDVGHIDERGYLYLLDRNKDVIISGGANIYPREVEEVLLQHSQVYEVAVIGAPDLLWGETPIAVVSLTPGAADHETITQALTQLCQQNLASYKKPRRIDFVESLPKNAYGKILKREIRDRYWQDQERKI